MQISLRSSFRLLIVFCACALFAPVSRGAELAAADGQFLKGYEQVRAALAADDLPAAKKAVATLAADAPGAKVIAEAKTLDAARKGFEQLSAKAVKLVDGVPGYFVLNCPMVSKDWVQTNELVANPYMGKLMSDCGEVKKPEAKKP